MFRKLLNVFRPNRLDADLREELEFHRSQTAGSLGNITGIEDRMRDASTLVWLETLLQDIRYGFRQLRRSPIFVATAVLSLALGIGANTAIFTLISAVMLQLLPVHDPTRLVLFYDGLATGTYSGGDPQGNEFSFAFYQYLKAHNDSFEDLCAFRQGDDRVTMHVSASNGTGPWENAKVHLVSGNYFELLGVNAAAGRLLEPFDDSLSAPPAAVLSYPFWRDRFRSSPAIIGHSVVLNRTAFTVVGIAAAQFFGDRVQPPPDFFIPLSTQPQMWDGESFLTKRDIYWLNFFGRLKPGVTLSAAQAASNVRLHDFYLDQAGSAISTAERRKIENVNLHLKPGGGGISGTRYLYAQPLQILMAVVAVVLLIACANVATLLLARAAARQPEFLARLALGASRIRLLRQVLTESILLSFLGGLIGVAFAWWSVKLLLLLFPMGSLTKVKPDPLVIAFTFALSIFTGVFFGIFPALKYSGLEPRAGNVPPVIFRKARFSTSQALIALQIALCLILLTSAGLLAHSFFALETQNLGFERDHTLVIDTDASLAGYKPAELFSLFRDLGDRLAHLPGVTSAGIARFTPISGYNSSSNFSIEGYNIPAGMKMRVYHLPVAPNFLETLRIPLLLGRTISVRDIPTSPAVAVVNQTFVNTYFPHQNPIGQHILIGSPFKAPGVEIVGVVEDSSFFDLREKTPPMAFFSLWQQPSPGVQLVLRTRANPLDLAGEVRQTLKQINGRLPILKISTLDAQLEKSLAQQKAITILCGIFGALALLLAAIGIYGTLAYSVSGRTREIGVRVAIGAQRRNVIWLILRDSLLLITIGLLMGLPLTIGGTRWLKSFLFGIGQVDPLSFGSAVLLIVALALLAGYFPASRAARIDPMRALRQE